MEVWDHEASLTPTFSFEVPATNHKISGEVFLLFHFACLKFELFRLCGIFCFSFYSSIVKCWRYIFKIKSKVINYVTNNHFMMFYLFYARSITNQNIHKQFVYMHVVIVQGRISEQ